MSRTGPRAKCGLGIVLVCLSACSPLPTYRYRMTVEVETPIGVKTGSSVIEVNGRTEPRLLPDMAGRALKISGEAVAVDLPNGQTLFALLAGLGFSPELISEHILVTPQEHATYDNDEIASLLSRERMVGEIPRGRYPILAVFTDPNNPQSIEGVDPDAVSPKQSGHYRIRRITIGTTHDPVTTGIDNRLPWLRTFKGTLIVRSSDNVRHHITTTAFERS